jgi:PIN domain nuclease of toxin-antitoxin system
VGLGAGPDRRAVQGAPEGAVILLDTNALIWLVQGHPRARRLEKLPRLFLSPATLLEIQFLEELGRLRVASGRAVEMLAADPRWKLDDPPAVRWFDLAGQLSWTRDPFDRLIAAHAQLRGWKLATGDARLLAAITPSGALAI